MKCIPVRLAAREWLRCLSRFPRTVGVLLIGGILLITTGCATAPRNDDQTVLDAPIITGQEYYNRAVVAHNKGKLKAAIASYDLAIRQDSSFVMAYYGRANAKSALLDLKGALVDYDRAVYYNLRFAEAFYGRGNIKRALGDIAGAREDYDETLRLDPQHIYAHVNRADLERDLGHLEAAVREYKAALKIDPKCSQAISGLASARKMGASSEAIEPTTSPREIFALSLLNEQPRPFLRSPPDYPLELRKAGATGQVLIEFIVTSNGDVVNAFAVRATDPRFIPAAVAAVSQWKFHPGRIKGRAVHTLMQQSISFDLELTEPEKK